MKLPARPGAGTAAALALTLLFALWRALAGDPLTDGLERRLLDLRFQLRGPWAQTDSVSVVAIDEATLARRPGAADLRAAVAEAIPRILAHEPRALALDLLFVERTPADPALARSLSSDPRVIIALAALNAAPGEVPAPPPPLAQALERSAIRVTTRAPGAPGPPVSPLLLPTPRIAQAARMAHVNLMRDPDRVARAAPLALRDPQGRRLPALPLAAAATARGASLRLDEGRRVMIDELEIPTDPAGRVVIDHPGGDGALDLVGLETVLAGEAPAALFRDRMVFIGATAESLRDVFVTPYGPDRAGVEVLAGLAAGLEQGRVIRRDGITAAISGALGLALCAGCLAAARARGNVSALALGAAVWVAGAAAAQVAFAAEGVWLEGTVIAFGLAAGAVAGAERRYRETRREASQMGLERANLARFVAPALADRLARSGPEGVGRRMQPAAILFVDVAGFTTLSEQAGPEATAEFLSALHAAFEQESDSRAGIVADYQGDGAMIVFGLPDPAPDDAARALDCAAALVQGAAALPPLVTCAGPPRLRASVHHGPVAAAALGGRRQSVVTVAGDTVNLAARLQESAKSLGVDLVTTRGTLDAAGLTGEAAAAAGYAFLDHAPIRGRREPAEVWGMRPAPGGPA
ncbi:MAG: CHASE2 domain-containing protein [Pseudomonadota bacterium]